MAVSLLFSANRFSSLDGPYRQFKKPWSILICGGSYEHDPHKSCFTAKLLKTSDAIAPAIVKGYTIIISGCAQPKTLMLSCIVERMHDIVIG